MVFFFQFNLESTIKSLLRTLFNRNSFKNGTFPKVHFLGDFFFAYLVGFRERVAAEAVSRKSPIEKRPGKNSREILIFKRQTL